MSSRRILVLNGPNLNLLGTREPATYGHETLADVARLCAETAAAEGYEVDFRQTNHEGELLDWIHAARGAYAGVVINPAAWTHTSVALRDALVASELPVYEVHLSNVHRREAFRHHSYVSGIAVGVICGLGSQGYRAAISALIAHQETNAMTAPKSVLAGLIGAGIQASLTPAMHEREGDAQGLRYLYRLIDLDVLGLSADALPELLQAAQRTGFTGLNITFPCKQAIIPLLDDLSPEARGIGAVNTVVLADGRTVGHNTDCLGFAEGFRRGLPDVSKRLVVQLGAGGAGSAVAHALLAEGVDQLFIFDVEAERAQALVDNLTRHFGPGRAAVGTDRAAAVAAADGLVNTSPVGMAKLPGMPLPAELLHPGLWVAEIIYFPLETELLRQARALGCRTLDGGTMAVFQAVKAFELFSGRSADAERMQAHFAELRD